MPFQDGFVCQRLTVVTIYVIVDINTKIKVFINSFQFIVRFKMEAEDSIGYGHACVVVPSMRAMST